MCGSLDRSLSSGPEVPRGYAAHFHGGVHATSFRARPLTNDGRAHEPARSGADAALGISRASPCPKEDCPLAHRCRHQIRSASSACSKKDLW